MLLQIRTCIGFRITEYLASKKLRQLSAILIVLTLSIMVGTPAAASNLNWNGSLETGPEYGDGSGETIYDNDFRLKLQASHGDFQSAVLLLQYQAQIPVSGRTAGDAVARDQLIVNQAYLDLKLPQDAMFRIGRQKISWGSGMAWNPTNYIGADKNRADLNNESPGTDALDFEKGWGDSQLTVLLKPGPLESRARASAPDSWGKAIKYATRWGHHDLAFSLYQQGEANGFGIDWATSIAAFTVYAEIAAKTDAGRCYIGESGGQPVPLTRPGNARYIHAVAGLNRMLPGDWLIQFEYYYNQAGWDAAEAANYYRYQGAMQISSFFGDLRRNYLYTLIRKGEVVTDLSATLNILGNLDDGSLMLVPGLEYRWRENTTANLTVTWFTGTASSEFGTMPDRLQIAAKVTVSF